MAEPVPPPQVVVMPLICGRCGVRGEVQLLDLPPAAAVAMRAGTVVEPAPEPTKQTTVICRCNCGARETKLPIRLMLAITIKPDLVEILGVPLAYEVEPNAG